MVANLQPAAFKGLTMGAFRTWILAAIAAVSFGPAVLTAAAQSTPAPASSSAQAAAGQATPGAAPIVVTPQERRWQADRLFDQARYDEARDAYLAIYDEFATDAEFNRDLGLAFYRARQPDLQKAIQYWSKSWQIDGKEDLKVEAARAYARTGQWEKGTKLLLDAAAAHPQHPEHWRDAAEVAESARQFAQAEEWYRTYLARRPSDATVRIALARVLAGTKQYQEAITEFTTVLASSPKSTPARLGLAQTLAWKGDLAESIRRYDELLREQPANLDAQKGQAFALLWAGKWEQAKPLFQSVNKRRPGDQEVRTALVEVGRLERVAAERADAVASPAGVFASKKAEIEDAFARRDGAAAVSLLNDALAENPADAGLRRRLAQAYVLAGNPGAAIDVLQALRTERPDDADVLRELASVQVGASRLPEAVDTLFAFLALRPDDRGARVDVARVLSWTRRFDEATREYERVLAADPDNVECLVGLAQVEAWQGHYAVAITKFDEVLGRRPGQREALIGRAQALFWTGKRQESLDAFAALERQFPDDKEVAKLAADIREADRQATLDAMDTKAAIRFYEDQLAAKPGDVALQLRLGGLYLRDGDTAKAVAAYRTVSAARPDDQDVKLELARALAASKAYVESAGLLREYIARKPDPSRRIELAQVLASARDYTAAAVVYRELIAEDADGVDARLGLARILSWSRDYAGSIEAYKELIARHPDNRDARVEYARVLSWKGDMDRALQLFTELEREYPGDRDVLLGKGQVLQWSGRPREAQRVLVPLLERFPDDRDIRVAVAGMQLALGRGDLALQELQVAGAGAVEDADIRAMRNLAARQVRPTLFINVNPSRDTDDLEILASAATLYFSAIPRVRSYVRATYVPSQTPTVDRVFGRDAVFGSSIQFSPALTVHGEIGANVGADDEKKAIGGGGLAWSPAAAVRIGLDASRQFINYLPLAFERNISRDLYTGRVDYRAGRALLHGDYFYGEYSDGNRARGGNAIASLTLVKRRGATVEAGYLFSLSRFANDPGNGYYAPSRLQRHAGLVNVFGRVTPWFGLTVAGTVGAEQALDSAEDDAFRPDGSVRGALEFTVGERLKFSVGYGYSRVASLARSGAYASQGVTGGLEVGF